MIDLENLTDEERQYIAEMIIRGCSEGDIPSKDYRGWWKLAFNKWDDKE